VRPFSRGCTLCLCPPAPPSVDLKKCLFVRPFNVPEPSPSWAVRVCLICSPSGGAWHCISWGPQTQSVGQGGGREQQGGGREQRGPPATAPGCASVAPWPATSSPPLTPSCTGVSSTKPTLMAAFHRGASRVPGVRAAARVVRLLLVSALLACAATGAHAALLTVRVTDGRRRVQQRVPAGAGGGSGMRLPPVPPSGNAQALSSFWAGRRRFAPSLAQHGSHTAPVSIACALANPPRRRRAPGLDSRWCPHCRSILLARSLPSSPLTDPLHLC
jgi:hypothetical protein